MNDERMLLTAIAPWFGGKRTLAPEIVRQLGPHKFYFEGCAGSLAVIMAKEPSEHEQVCDLHGDVTNLAWVLQDGGKAADLYERLQRVCYSDAIYLQAKQVLSGEWRTRAGEDPEADVGRAYWYFIASWMGRNGVAGTASVNYQIATRWTANGGSGPLRFRNATESIPAWHERLRNVHILRRDLFDVLPKIDDAPGTAIYIDPPYLPDTVGKNSKYLCNFSPQQHRMLADMLGQFKRARVVVSYYDSPTLDLLYSAADGWTKIDCVRHKHLHTQNKRGSKRSAAPEVLLVNGGAVVEECGEDAMLFGVN